MEYPDNLRAEAALQLAIARLGGVTATADAIGITKSAVSQWTVCPAERVLAMEQCSGVSRCDLRPDLYPPNEKGPGADRETA